MSEIESVAVVGGGFMGTGIAEAVAVAGMPVIVRDVDQTSVGRAGERIETSLARAVRGGKLDEGEARVVRDRIELTTELGAIAEADLVVEAVPEDEHLKLEVMGAIDSVVSDHAIVASNTSIDPDRRAGAVHPRSDARARTALLLPRSGDESRRGGCRPGHQ